MTAQVQHLVQRVRSELKEIERALLRAEEGWERAKRFADDYYLDGVALNLHSFYGGIERIFERIAAVVDGAVPTGGQWHQALLKQMNEEVPEVRPAVISEATRVAIDEYRGFRHVVRNVYTFNFDVSKVEKLVMNAPSLFLQVQTELLAFAKFLEEQK